MKKYMLIICLAAICHAGIGQNDMNQLFSQFSKQSNVTSVNVGSMAMKLASFFTDTFGVDDIEVLDFKECDSETLQRLSKAVKELKDPAYETMVTANEKGNNTKIMIRIQQDVIKELVVVTTGSNPSLIRIKGNIKPSDWEKVVKEHKNGC